VAVVAVPPPLASAVAVLFGHYGDVTRQAHDRGVCRQTLYRETAAVLQALDAAAWHAQRDALRQQLAAEQARGRDLAARLHGAVVLDADQQAAFASTAQAEGVSLPVARRLLQVCLGPATPSVAQLGRWTRAAGRRAAAVLAVLDAASRPLARHAAADELFAGRRPVLMTVEPESWCWLSGRRAERRDGPTWAAEFRQLPALEQVTRDAGSGLAKGLEQVNHERRAAGRPPVADQADHFHVLREGTRALRRLQGQATRAVERAEQAERALQRHARRGQNQAGRATVARRRWREAEEVLDRWGAAERAWQRLRAALGLVTPAGALNTRAQAEAVVAEVLPALGGPEWAAARRQLARPELFTFLDRAHEQLAALPLPADVRRAAVRHEVCRRRPEALRGEGRGAAALRGVLLVAGLVLTWSGAVGEQAGTAVRAVLRQAVRASSAVEGLNSVLRMQQGRHRRLTQELLDLKRLYWNCRAFRTGPRRGRTPYQLLGVALPPLPWWELLNRPPEQLRQELSAPQVAA
jgi:hypothetical protein